MKTYRMLLIFFLALTTPGLAATGEHIPTPAAKAEFEKGRAAGTDWKAAVAHYRKAVDLDPDYYEAHHYYILFYQNASGVSDTEEAKSARKRAQRELENLYQKWSRKHPDKAVYQWALGILYDYEKPDLAVQYYKKALTVDPTYGPAYDMLGISAEEQGDLALSREYEQKAHEAWPDDASFWRHYIGSWIDADPKKAEKMALQMAEKFPDDGASMLGYLATRARDVKQSRELLELLWNKYPKTSGGWTLMPLFGIYMKTDPAKALKLAEDRAKTDPKDQNWPMMKNYAETVLASGALLAQGKTADVLAALDQIKLPRYGVDRDFLEITRANALAADGQIEKAYKNLVDVFAKTPSDDLRNALLVEAGKLRKDGKQVDADVWTERSSNAKPGIPFSLVSFTTGKPVSLDQYKGKVFLLNFFYPKCGPCRGEFPYLQAVLDKYKNKGFQILAVNGLPPEDEWVMPLMKGFKLGFLPLKGNADVVKAYKVRGYPSNFLYGLDGRIYYTPPPVSTPSAQHALEIEIESLLRQESRTASPTAQ